MEQIVDEIKTKYGISLSSLIKKAKTEEENIRNAYEKGRQEAQKDEIKFLEYLEQIRMSKQILKKIEGRLAKLKGEK